MIVRFQRALRSLMVTNQPGGGGIDNEEEGNDFNGASVTMR